ncbi:protein NONRESPONDING TO OXYLIPINS 2, mitochondrial isoform X1 [Impatiens glandulifera]|uniref:protein NONRESPONDING TO OXYLIPINS 2, mitochondrial isoform X1 n=1 Tax=Impatiens glandulifera TaxID=253017 RepID=UPI001FB05C90|nr:protein NONRESPONDING TO OXYLIPINS 2, mitochondrial isoform X1 [Impatiens glandulifera]
MSSSACRSALMAASRSLAPRLRPLLSKTQSPKSATSALPSSSNNKSFAFSASRIVSALGIAESMMPLHSAVASARLRSNIGADSSCWSLLSQGVSIPL